MRCDLPGGWRRAFAFKEADDQAAQARAVDMCRRMAQNIEWRLESVDGWWEIQTRRVG